MLAVIDQIREWANTRPAQPQVKETYFQFDEALNQWITDNPTQVPVMLDIQFVEAALDGSNNLNYTIICRWSYTTTIGDNAARIYQQQALHELSQLALYLGGRRKRQGAYFAVNSARYTIFHSDTPFQAAGASVELGILTKNNTFECCPDFVPPDTEPVECQPDCPQFDLTASIEYAAVTGGSYVAPDVVPVLGQEICLAFNYTPSPDIDGLTLDTIQYVNTDGQTFSFGAGNAILNEGQFILTREVIDDMGEGTIWVRWSINGKPCEVIKIPVPSTP